MQIPCALRCCAAVPVILFTFFWRRFNTTGAIVGMLTGLISAIVLVALSPSVWSPEAGKAILVGQPLFPLANPGIVSIPLGFIGAVIGTLLTSRQKVRAAVSEKFDEILVRANTGIKPAGQ